MVNPNLIRPTKKPENWRVLERQSQGQSTTLSGIAHIPNQRLMLPGADIHRRSADPALRTWQTASEAQFTPFEIDAIRTLIAIRYAVGTVGATPTFDVGIYDVNGVRICSDGGRTVTNNTNYAVAFSQVLTPGRYYAAGVSSGTTVNVFSDESGVTSYAMMGLQTAGSAYPLPATVTFDAAPLHGVFCCSLEFE